MCASSARSLRFVDRQASGDDGADWCRSGHCRWPSEKEDRPVRFEYLAHDTEPNNRPEQREEADTVCCLASWENRPDTDSRLAPPAVVLSRSLSPSSVGREFLRRADPSKSRAKTLFVQVRQERLRVGKSVRVLGHA